MAVYKFLRFPEGKLKAVTFSYDDGVRADIRFSDILSAHGLKGTFNINSSRVSVNGEGCLSYKELKEYILDRGHEVAVHGACHRASTLQRTVYAGMRGAPIFSAAGFLRLRSTGSLSRRNYQNRGDDCMCLLQCSAFWE